MTEIDDIYLAVFWWTLGVLVVAWVVLAGALLMLRGKTVAMEGSRVSRSGFDLAWAIAPAVVVLLVAVPAVRGALAVGGPPEGTTPGQTTESVDGQWADTEQAEAEAIATPVTGELELPGACCATSRYETATEGDDTEADDTEEDDREADDLAN